MDESINLESFPSQNNACALQYLHQFLVNGVSVNTYMLLKTWALKIQTEVFTKVLFPPNNPV